jgi:hypothetical protein
MMIEAALDIITRQGPIFSIFFLLHVGPLSFPRIMIYGVGLKSLTPLIKWIVFVSTCMFINL